MSARLRGEIALTISALFAFAWAVTRACVQSVTMDEADTYLKFVARAAPFHWYAAANNHILNSVLMRLTTSIFGVSPLTVRLPALLGAAIYIGACFYICRASPTNAILRFLLFVCLVYNPFVFDFLVAARGYGLASGLLLCAVVVPAVGRLRGKSAVKLAAACSALVGLSFAANFSFAFADLGVLLLVTIWMRKGVGFSARLLAAAILPGALITVLLPLGTILHWPPGQLYEGATSLRQTFTSVIHWSLYELNPEVANPLVMRALRAIRNWLFPALGVVVLWRIALLVRGKPEDATARWFLGLAEVTGGALVLATAFHWVALRAFGLLLPVNRTALFYVPLGTLCIGALASIPLERRSSRASYYASMVVLSALAAHFVFSMRLTYFGEWRYGADTKKVYAALADYNHEYCVEQVGTNWLYSSSMNFYRALSPHESFAEFQPGLPLPIDDAVYVLNSNLDREFIEQQKLNVVFRGDDTDVVIAVRPERLVRCR